MRVPLAAGLIAGLLITALSGCTSSSGRCVDYVALDSPQQRFDAADTVIIAEVQPTGRTIESYSQYPLYRAVLIRALKGTTPRSFDLIAPSDQCEQQGRPAEYLEGNPLAHFRRGVLYLVKGEKTWQLYTPGSLDPLPAGAPLPFTTRTPLPSPTGG